MKTQHNRQYTRINSSIVAKINSAQVCGIGIIKNLSAGGAKISIENDENIKKDDVLEIDFQYKDFLYNVFGIVTRDSNENNPYGIKFIYKNNNDREKINKKIYEEYFSNPAILATG